MIRLKAGVLSFTMYIAIIIAIILLAIILLGYYSRLETAEYRIRLRLLDNLQSGVEWTLAAGESVPYFGVKEIDLYGELSDSVRVKRYPWGLFDLYYVQSFRGDRVFQNVLTTGQRRSEEAYASLYLIDEGRPLSLVGDAYLGGDVYLPLAGIQSAYINRVGYTNEKLTQGLRKRSEKEMPELQQEGLDLFFRSYSMFPQFEQVEAEGASVFQAFEQEQLHLIEQGAIEVTDTIQGMVFLDASSTITFDSLSYTQHVVARAEQIIFKSGFTGQGQFFAEDTIIVESGAKLLYPSVLMINQERARAVIKLEQDAEVNGLIILTGDDDNYYQRVLSMVDGAHVNGMLYVNGMLTHFGELNGHATVRKFLINSFSGVYENYFMNGTMKAELDSAFVLPNTWHVKTEKEVMQWLD